jgi:biofilm PGA synthesis N-glycosyltransferase PgaC
MEFPIRFIIYFSIYVGFLSMTFYLLGLLEKARKPKEKPILRTCSIIIPAFNEQASLEKTVKSSLNLNYPKEKIEILIVDDGSTDKTKQIGQRLASENARVKYIYKKNGGKGTALNLGIKKAKNEIIISFDADSEVNPDALTYYMEYYMDPKVMSVTPAMKVLHPKGILQRVQAIEYDLGIFLRKVFADINAIHVTPGPFSSYRKSFFEKHGGYDEKNITEDLEIAMRIQSLQYKIQNSMKSLVYTIAPNTLRTLTRQRRRWYFGMIYNLRKYRHLFSRKYGELGLIVLPLSIISILTVVAITSYTLIKILSDWTNTLNLYSTIGFDFINNLNFQWYILNLSFFKIISENIVIFSVFFILLSVVMLQIINKHVKSKDTSTSIFLSYGIFLIFYGMLFSAWWVMAWIYSRFKKEIKW